LTQLKTIVVASGHPLELIGLESVVSASEGMVCSAAAPDENALLLACSAKLPDAVILDFTSTGFSVDSISGLRAISKNISVIAISGDEGGRVITEALKAGVKSYIKRDCDIQEVKDCLRETLNGQRFFCNKILAKIKKEDINPTNTEIAEVSCHGLGLSERELEIIVMIAEGYTNARIAELLYLSSHTVNTHRRNIMAKLGVNNTAAVVMFAVKSELVSPNKFLFAAG